MELSPDFKAVWRRNADAGVFAVDEESGRLADAAEVKDRAGAGERLVGLKRKGVAHLAREMREAIRRVDVEERVRDAVGAERGEIVRVGRFNRECRVEFAGCRWGRRFRQTGAVTEDEDFRLPREKVEDDGAVIRGVRNGDILEKAQPGEGAFRGKVYGCLRVPGE